MNLHVDPISFSARPTLPTHLSNASLSCGCVLRSARSLRRCPAGCRPRRGVATRRRAGCRERSGQNGCTQTWTLVRRESQWGWHSVVVEACLSQGQRMAHARCFSYRRLILPDDAGDDGEADGTRRHSRQLVEDRHRDRQRLLTGDQHHGALHAQRCDACICSSFELSRARKHTWRPLPVPLVLYYGGGKRFA